VTRKPLTPAPLNSPSTALLELGDAAIILLKEDPIEPEAPVGETAEAR
jgi:hypothetical protein